MTNLTRRVACHPNLGPADRTLLRCSIDQEGCVHCGGRSFEQHPIISDELAEKWELSDLEKAYFDEREGHVCTNCHMSKRVRMLLWSLKRTLPRIDALHVLHLNQVNNLSGALSGAASLVETVFDSGVALGTQVRGLTNQDFERLKLPDDQFNLVVHSETLEHVHDYEKAFREAWRVLEPGGYHAYTIPLLHNRSTRRRAVRDEGTGETKHLLPPSAHGCGAEDLVVWEFGGDFIRSRSDQIYRIDYDDFESNPTVFCIVERRRSTIHDRDGP